MELAQMTGPVKKSHRWWMPATILILAMLGYLALWLFLPKDHEKGYRSMDQLFIALVSLVLLGGWFLLFSRFRKSRTIPTMLAALALPIVFLRVPGAAEGSGVMKLEPSNWLKRLLGMDDFAVNQAPAGTVADLTIKRDDSPAYRGANRDGVVIGPPISLDWKKQPPKMLWKQPAGKGWAGFSEANEFIVTIEQRKDAEVVCCYSAKTGQQIWSNGWETYFRDFMGGDGPRATPTIYDGDVYAYGANGKLACLEGKSGTLRWSVDTLGEKENIMWGMAGSPLVYDDKVVVCPGVQNGRPDGKGIIAFDRKTGKEIWSAGSHQASYSSPMLATLDGVLQVLVFDGSGCGGYDPQTGASLWYFPFANEQKISAAQPLVLEKNEVFLSIGYNTGATLLKVQTASPAKESSPAQKVEQVFRTPSKTMRCKFTSPVFFEGYIYGLNDGILECLDAKTGKTKWKDERRARADEAYGNGQILLCEGHLIVATEFGELVLVEANPEELVEKGRISAIAGKPSWNNPCMADGVIYLRTPEEMAAYDLKK